MSKRLVWLGLAALASIGSALPSKVEAQTRRVQLNVLVLSAGDVGTAMFKAGLQESLVPFTEIDLTAAGRPTISAAFLADQPSFNVRRAKFQAVVLPSEAPTQLSAAELAALDSFEREFKVRQLDAYVYPSPAVGMNWPADPGYLGPLDGMSASVTAQGRAAGFGYLAGPVPFDDLSEAVFETYGYLATPLPPDTVNQRSFTPFAELPIPGTGVSGVLLGVYNDGGREQMILTSSLNQFQLQQQLLFPGMLDWLTYGVHFGTERNYLAVHVDDVFLGDQRWVMDANCTSGDDCPPTVTAPDIIMTSADVDYLVAWQQQQGIKLDMVFNGFGYDDTIARNGSFPLGTRLLQARSSLRWINHTYTHAYLGCIQDFSVIPWRCATSSSGVVQWVSYNDVYNELNRNIQFATQRGISIQRNELVTGEHSGLRRTPQEPSDNPNLITAINRLNIRWAGSDNSRESDQRALGSALSVPRYPMNIFYNTGTRAEAVDEYNWIYTSAADGGSGVCESNPSSTCITPLSPASDFDAHIVPLEARFALFHALANNAKPHYAHQSNLAEERILYPVLDKLLADYRSLYATTAPLINPTHTQSGTELQSQSRWKTERSFVSGYVQQGRVYLSTNQGLFSTTNAPLSVPVAASVPALGVYGTQRTGWIGVSGFLGANYSLPASVGYPR